MNNGAAEARRDRVMVATKGNQRLRSHRPGHIELGRERHQRRRAQCLVGGQGGDGGGLAVADPAAVVERDREAVQPGLRLGDGGVVGDRAPPSLRSGVVRLLHDAFAVPAPRRADHGADPVVLRDLGERGSQPARCG
ncbi:hypothetical protein [Amycolatopsis jejuensis]|uniref:hypothetical protein n=1 Tax=Amycolatopsis jejuensis TaxID=330084 RepID=UPI000B160554|nr:hypothetical protein [Amycolatopsis jejuensis]